MIIIQVSAAADRTARRGASRPLVTDDRHQFITLTVHLGWQHLRRSTWQLQLQPFQRYDWCPPKFQRFTWPNHAPEGWNADLHITLCDV